MIKRRFYKQDHGDKSDSSDSSSSDESDSAPELEVVEDHQVEEEEEEEEGMWNYEKAQAYPSPELEAVEDHQAEEKEEEDVKVMWNYEKALVYPSTAGSGYESEDSSNNQGETDASGLLINEEEWTDEGLGNNKDRKAINKVPIHKNKRPPKTTEKIFYPNDSIQGEISNFILKCKSTFKCRLCPRVLCLNEATLMTHLASKRHGRSKKLFGEGRLKVMLNSDEELEEQEIHAEIPVVSKMKKYSGRQRQSHRRKKRMRSGSMKGNSKASVENAVKKRCRTD